MRRPLGHQHPRIAHPLLDALLTLPEGPRLVVLVARAANDTTIAAMAVERLEHRTRGLGGHRSAKRRVTSFLTGKERPSTERATFHFEAAKRGVDLTAALARKTVEDLEKALVVIHFVGHVTASAEQLVAAMMAPAVRDAYLCAALNREPRVREYAAELGLMLPVRVGRQAHDNGHEL